MNKEKAAREIDYQLCLISFGKMLEAGLITQDEYSSLQQKLQEKYKPYVSILLSDYACYVPASE